MSQRSVFRNRAEYAIAVVVVKSLEWAPLPLAHGLARFYVRLLDLGEDRSQLCFNCHGVKHGPQGELASSNCRDWKLVR